MPKKPKEAEIRTIVEVADIVFSIFPEEELKKCEKHHWSRTLTLKDQFIIHFTNKGVRPRSTLNVYHLEKATLKIMLDKNFNFRSPKLSAFNLFFSY